MNMNDQPQEGNDIKQEDSTGGQPQETPQAAFAAGTHNPDADRPRITRVPPRYQPGVLEEHPTRRSGWSIFFSIILVLVLTGAVITVFSLFTNGERFAALAGKERIGLIRIEGEIYQGQEKDFWMDSIHKMAEDEAIKGIVLRIDSPGGAVGASQELYLAINDLRNNYHKPVYVSMGDLAASGGYYIASAADRIYALGGTLTGSIGVIFKKPQIGELAQKLGIETEIVKSGRFKDSGSITRALTDDERKVFESLIGNTYDQFVNDILLQRQGQLELAARTMPTDKWQAFLIEKPEPLTARSYLIQIADGRVYTGLQAKDLGLVDKIGSLDDTLIEMARDLGIEGRPSIYRIDRKQSLRELLSSKLPLSLPLGNKLPMLEYHMTLP